MAQALTSDQVNQVINNTVLVILARPDLRSEWSSNLLTLLKQTREAALDEESVFLAAVLTLLDSPEDTLPTGTTYDRAWQSILIGLQTGVVQDSLHEGDQAMSLDRLLNSIVQAVATVIRHATDQKAVIVSELQQMRRAAEEARVPELIDWLDDVLAVLHNTPPKTLSQRHQGIYAIYWTALMNSLQLDD